MHMWKKIVIGIVLLFALFFCLLCLVVGNYDGDLINEVSNKTKIKDIVYVLVPENDFSKKKMIVGLIKHNTDESASSAEEDSTASQYLVIADNVLDINS